MKTKRHLTQTKNLLVLIKKQLISMKTTIIINIIFIFIIIIIIISFIISFTLLILGIKIKFKNIYTSMIDHLKL